MSNIAEYAGLLHEKEKKIVERKLIPGSYPAESEKIHDIRAVICDVYGTLINYWRPEFGNSNQRIDTLLSSFRKMIDRFGMERYLLEMSPNEPAEKTLSDLYSGLIALSHEKSAQNGIEYPEVKIEKVWELIILMLKRRGYEPKNFVSVEEKECSRCFAFTYNFFALGRQLYPGVIETLEKLKASNIVVGILSNAQFYTPIDLTLMIREQSNGKYDDYLELFEIDLTFYSYEYGFSKPNQLLYRRLYDALYEYQILPSQTIMVGNDLSIDIAPAKTAGMKTALFTGDSTILFTHNQTDIIPDIAFSQWEQLLDMVSFFSEGNT